VIRALAIAATLAACIHPHAPEDTDDYGDEMRDMTGSDPAGANAAFSALTALTTGGGTWQAEMSGKTVPATFEIGSNGYTVVQRSGYLAVFQVVGANLQATVFPDDGYIARYRSTSASATTIDMRWIETINARGPHAIEHLGIEVRGADEVVEHWGTGDTAFDVTLRRSR
jgi:hypothetical protein